jgi:DNA invertase Pin-like site-specific DNA recombinase
VSSGSRFAELTFCPRQATSPVLLGGTREVVPQTESRLVRAAEYVRMSTEHQQYSTENQGKIIRQYANTRGMEVVRTFADAGKSGLRIDGRNALKELIGIIQMGQADFEVILVYDVSRWGRFQDADESAYYEYICRRSGINVHYCAEQFENDGSPVSTIVKGVKRAMAGEYSRELSSKVFIGQCRLIELGFRQGGAAGFGLRRMLRDSNGNKKGVLDSGEQKSIQTDRVILVPGPADEVEIIREIYDMFVQRELNESAIANALNAREMKRDPGHRWTRGTVHGVLTNEKYIGNNVYNKESFKLKRRRVVNPPDMWVRCDAAFEPIVSSEQFYTARGIIRERSRKLSNEELLQQLRTLLERKGHLSALLIDEVEGMPSSSVYRVRFGSLVRAYTFVGYSPDRNYEFIEINRMLRRLHRETVASVIRQISELGGEITEDPKTDLLTINNEFTTSIVLARCRSTEAGFFRWQILFDSALAPDITVVVRMISSNDAALDYYLFPSLDVNLPKLLLRESNSVGFETYRFDTLAYFFGMARRSKLPDAA